MEEIWKDIEGYDGDYQVSNLGRVKSFKYNKDGEIMKQGTTDDGYKNVALSKNGHTKKPTVHRLVALAFIPNPNNLETVNHIDEDKTNNRVDNLEWMSRVDNMRYGGRNERISKTMTNGSTSKGVRGVNIKTGEVIEFPSMAEAKRNGYHAGHICECCKGNKKQYKGFRWMYLD